MSPNGPRLSSSRVSAADYDEAFDYFYQKRMTDGLPVVPPTESRVTAMIKGTNSPPDTVIGLVAPAMAEATVEKIAINAVMAGCLPEYMPILVAAVEAMVEEPFDLHGIQTTTNPVAVGIIVNGPIRQRIDLNCESGCFGPGWRANATIGRALRLILLNLGGATPGDVDKSTQGSPGKYAICFGENEEESPWSPLHAERGFPPTQSCVTVFAPSSTLSMTFSDRLIAEEGLPSFAACMTAPATTQYSLFNGEPLLVLNPIHANEFAQHGYSKDDIKRRLWEQCRYPVDELPSYQKERRYKHPNLIFDGLSPTVPSWQDYMIVVAGGHGGLHSTYMPSFGEPRTVTKLIREV